MTTAEEAASIVDDVVTERNSNALGLTLQPTLGLDSLITAVGVLAQAVIGLERVVASRTDHLA